MDFEEFRRQVDTMNELEFQNRYKRLMKRHGKKENDKKESKAKSDVPAEPKR